MQFYDFWAGFKIRKLVCVCVCVVGGGGGVIPNPLPILNPPLGEGTMLPVTLVVFKGASK